MADYYNRQACEDALDVLRHRPLDLSEAHHELLDWLGRGEEAREAQRLAILARVPAVVTKSLPEAPAPPAKKPTPPTKPDRTEEIATMLVDVVAKAVKPLRDRIKNLESENRTLADRVVQLEADAATEADRVRR